MQGNEKSFWFLFENGKSQGKLMAISILSEEMQGSKLEWCLCVLSSKVKEGGKRLLNRKSGMGWVRSPIIIGCTHYEKHTLPKLSLICFLHSNSMVIYIITCTNIFIWLCMQVHVHC